jgi:hypothetical protein
VPPAVAELARSLFAWAIPRQHVIPAAYIEAIHRLATDERMQTVWTEICRKHPDGSFVHPARAHLLGDDGPWRPLLSNLPPAEPQERAAAILFSEATGCFIHDRRLGIFGSGPRTRTKAEIQSAASEFTTMAERLKEDADEMKRLGMWRFVPLLKTAVQACVEQAEARGQIHPQDPYVVERKSARLGDDWVRGFVVKMAETCRILFGSPMLGTAATLANVAYDRTDLNGQKVRGALAGYVAKRGRTAP